MAKKKPQETTGKGMTVFESDRHEDIGAIIFSVVVVAGVLIYMAFFVGTISFDAPSDGKILSIGVVENAPIKTGDVLLTMEVKEKKLVHGKTEEKVVKKEIKSKMNGTVIGVKKAVGDQVKKGKDVIMVLKPRTGTLP
jgi:acetyl/propionyl-CoA carboxylase alpha subunit